ncbi:putative Chloride channel [Rhodotorula toruloides ATCC 204091]|uniref:Putative chloride channel n=1 Tax=Rhodotorula toruloides TaxID=5286 RepID=A0A2T0A2M3_RHOTO|nr:putative Chloride channel [Rhodotorula toruloides ATCC 204091]PRQ72252.1 putative chloride channel [Rhodotorula toruloides]
MTLDAHPFANASPLPSAPTHRRLPSSTSETALFKPTQPRAAPPPAQPRKDASKLERVEKHKIELKRQMVAKRREAVTAPIHKPAEPTTTPANHPPSTLPPTPTSLPSTSLPPPRNALSTPRRPTHETGARERKRDMYGELGLGFGALTSHGEEQEEGERKGEERERGGYSSLQELLERHGYADTRVITPQSTLARPTAPHASSDAPTSPTPARSRSPSPAPPAEPTSSLAPPAPQLKDRPSLLSLRGLFSLFGSPNPDPDTSSEPSPPLASPTSSGSTARAADADADTSSVHHVVLSTPPPSSSAQPRRMRTTSEMYRWVSGVNEAIRPQPQPHPLSRVSTSLDSDARTPELCFDLAPGQDAEEEMEEDARSYSSSVSFELATRTPQTNFVGGMGEGYLSPSWGGGNDELSAPFGLDAASKRTSLRHTVSDSNLLPAYQSFAGLGIQVPPSPPHVASTAAEQAEEKETRRPPTPVASGRLWWAPATLLRERASQLFFPPHSSSPSTSASPALSAAPFPRSPIDAATGRSLLPSSSSRALHTRRSQPQLLRRAISTAGLVAPATVRQIRVVAKSSRDSLGSLESCVIVGGSVSGDEGEREGEMVPSWGEDLLGRRW